MKIKTLLIAVVAVICCVGYLPGASATSCSSLSGAQACRYYWEGCNTINGYTVPDSKKANCATWDTDSSSGCGCATCASGYEIKTVNEKYGTFGLSLTKRCVKSTTTPTTGVKCTTSNCTTNRYVMSNGTVYCFANKNSACTGFGQPYYGQVEFGLFSTQCANGKGVENTGTCAAMSCPSGAHMTTFTGNLYCHKDCSAGYYAISSATCEKCPTYTGANTTSRTNADDITECYVPKDVNISDASGTYHFTSNCYYSK